MKREISRRRFVQATAAAATTALSARVLGSNSRDPKALPTRALGNSGVQVPLIGFGAGSRWMSVEDDDQALEILEFALGQGLYYWDTAASYGNRRISSEERIGRILPPLRSKVFLVSKTKERSADQAKAEIERSLKRLRTDHIDLLHVHSILSVEDAERLGEKGMVLEALHQLKSEGVIKRIGFSGHTSADGMRRAAELYDFDAMMIALNHQKPSENFEGLPAPAARKKGMGVIGMKIVRPRESVQNLSPADLIRYGLSLPDFHMVNIGMDSIQVVKANVDLIRSFQPLAEAKMKEMEAALSPFFEGQGVAWMNPSYSDGYEPGKAWA